MASHFFSRTFLFALLVVELCCLPVKHGFNPASYSVGAAHAASKAGVYQDAPSGQFVAAQSNAPTGSVSKPVYQPPLQEPSYYEPGVQTGQQVYLSSGSSSHPQPTYTSVRQSPVGSSQPGAAYEPDFNWAVAPASLSSRGEDIVGSLVPENVSPSLLPPGPQYQAGELSHSEKRFEFGNSQMETEEQGFMPPPHLPLQSAGQAYTSQVQSFIRQPQPVSHLGGGWDLYPYYDFMFLTGQYPPGTVSHFSKEFEQGRDNWQDVHYERYYAPYNPSPVQQDSFTGLGEPMAPLSPYGQDGAHGLAPGSFYQPGPQTHSPAGTYNQGKFHGY